MEMMEYYQKNGLLIMEVARTLFVMDVGERMPTIDAFVNNLKVGRGTVQSAFRFFEDNSLVKFERMGRNGTVLSYVDKEHVWEHTGWGTLLGGCPVPNLEIITSISAAINQTLETKNVPYVLSFSAFSENRAMVLNNNHLSFILTTKMASDWLIKTYPNLEVAVELKGSKYSTPYVLVCRKNFPDTICRDSSIAISVNSPEQVVLGSLLQERYGMKPEIHSYFETVRALSEERVDYILARTESLNETLWRAGDFAYKILRFDDGDFIDASTYPVIISNRTNRHMAKLIRKLISPAEVEQIQMEILSGNRVNYYC